MVVILDDLFRPVKRIKSQWLNDKNDSFLFPFCVSTRLRLENEIWTVKLDIKHNIAIVLYKVTLPRALHWFYRYVLLPNKCIPCWKIICFLDGCHRCLALKLGHLVQLWRFGGLISKPSLAITRAQIRLTYKRTLCFGECFFFASVYSTAPCGHFKEFCEI